ncbi:hypothetical protein DBZ36_03755 [Alginatibacterium sediminis]|uniref:Uncharacterized protein n=1 Tax=Alginatibacterium sediminis TaxID=2164068 RepID=A0A420EFV3_9ALTE|nr:hypothetical protein [Alginatibacterium sediminis]RKF19591.1 hypothetical protein DBZ36_03755 [Alginatibacterium sediminis]
MLVSYYQKVQATLAQVQISQTAKQQLLSHAHLAYHTTQVSERPMVHTFKHQMLEFLLQSSDAREYNDSLQTEMERAWLDIVATLATPTKPQVIAYSRFEDSLEPHALICKAPEQMSSLMAG